MNAEQLKAIQAPLKEAYKDRPAEALVTLRAQGDLDFRGTLGVAKDCPVGFRAIRLRFEIDSAASPELLDKAVAVTERYCVVLQTIRSAPPISVSRAG